MRGSIDCADSGHLFQTVCKRLHFHRSDKITYSTGAFTLASAACPALRELEVYSWYLDQPPAPLAHLTRLHTEYLKKPPQSTTPLRRLATAAPRLEVRDWGNSNDPANAAAAEGHPCLHKLCISGNEEAWLRAIPRLPALSALEVYARPRLFEGKEAEGEADADAQASRVFGWLAHCERLSHLVLQISTKTRMSALELLARAGAVVGARLRSLTLNFAQPPRTAAAVAKAMQILGACYPHLEVLELGLPFHLMINAGAAKLLSRQFLLAVPALAPQCAALREVRVDSNAVQLQRHPDGGVAAHKCIGSCFDE